MPRTIIIALLVASIALVAAACGGSSSPDPNATTGPLATPSAAPDRPGDDGFRAFAQRFDAAVKSHDAAFIGDRLQTVPVDCATAPDANQIGGPGCDSPEQKYAGFPTGLSGSDGFIVPAAGIADGFFAEFKGALPDTHDAFGDGAPAVYGLNVAPDKYSAIVSALIPRPADFAGSGPLRIAVGTDWVYADGEWRMTSMLFAHVLAEDLLQAGVADSLYQHWERFSPG